MSEREQQLNRLRALNRCGQDCKCRDCRERRKRQANAAAFNLCVDTVNFDCAEMCFSEDEVK